MGSGEEGEEGCGGAVEDVCGEAVGVYGEEEDVYEEVVGGVYGEVVVFSSSFSLLVKDA